MAMILDSNQREVNNGESRGCNFTAVINHYQYSSPTQPLKTLTLASDNLTRGTFIISTGKG
ncbi:hypothetical protein E2C01_085981 [Portunus trituberculatus]|uniref:Uncharacterized protein n=1 Tax=Portunus trituberculatus TaxID=210409 RepID=A0A5B7J924_PORTR|nr:hypothetical protein [Portunus trituberculatus]